MGKIGGGFWPFLAGKRAGSDSEVLATLFHGPTQLIQLRKQEGWMADRMADQFLWRGGALREKVQYNMNETF